jgi:hypothetical protein
MGKKKKASALSGTQTLVATLKAKLRGQGVVYAELADRVGLSEASIKRIMASGQMTLKQLDRMCAAAKTSVIELAQEAAASSSSEPVQDQLTEDQEILLASDDRIFRFYYALALRMDLVQASKHVGFTDRERTKALVALDKCGLIVLHEFERVTLNVPNSAQWRSNGELMKKYGASLREAFFQSTFSGDHEFLGFRSVRILPETAEDIRGRLARIHHELRTAHKREFMSSDAESYSTLLAIRSWDNPLITQDGKKAKR